jgi:hypothetical protein
MNGVTAVPSPAIQEASSVQLLAAPDSKFASEPAPVAESNSSLAVTASKELIRWQTRLLPFMTIFLGVMAAAFFLFSGLHIYNITKFVEAAEQEDIRSQIVSEVNRSATPTAGSNDTVEHSLLLLEADIVDKRYHQAAGLLMSRIWSRQLAFVTGMVMAFVGSVFILGKLSEGTSNISGGAGEWKVAITSASPGIILSLFGTVVIIASMYVKATLEVADGPAYVNVLRPVVVNANTAAAKAAGVEAGASAPLTLDDLKKLEQSKPKAP